MQEVIPGTWADGMSVEVKVRTWAIEPLALVPIGLELRTSTLLLQRLELPRGVSGLYLPRKESQLMRGTISGCVHVSQITDILKVSR